jgi:hypothetical protein
MVLAFAVQGAIKCVRPLEGWLGIRCARPAALGVHVIPIHVLECAIRVTPALAAIAAMKPVQVDVCGEEFVPIRECAVLVLRRLVGNAELKLVRELACGELVLVRGFVQRVL